ncbi:PTR2-domain-containing protein [Dendrothele bispora CBS 962.96]|uniref:PTR2-domain-containing protein n=1 Tax=Dendrothele bispora (strain CBS 962.96) TaxID=1314807 RepID=A0A4V4HB35_DENBC|nr:PTR2-domain-containing protein [Dendrothele bispora CBS 962.96]
MTLGLLHRPLILLLHPQLQKPPMADFIRDIEENKSAEKKAAKLLSENMAARKQRIPVLPFFKNYSAVGIFAYIKGDRCPAPGSDFDEIQTYKNMRADDFWESAKPSKQQNRPGWMTFDDQWVDEVRRGIKACGVFVWYPIYWLSYNQLNNNLTSQAATLTVHGLPNDVLSNLDPFALIILIPLFDAFLYPTLKRIHINFSALKRITAGFATGSAAMIWAAVVQHIYKTGSYVLIAISEIFASITGLEYAFTKAPKNMRSLVMAIYLFTNAFGAALSEAFLPLLEDPLLTWNYGSVAIISAFGGIVFWLSVRKLDVQEDHLNNLAEGHMVVTPASNKEDLEKV